MNPLRRFSICLFFQRIPFRRPLLPVMELAQPPQPVPWGTRRRGNNRKRTRTFGPQLPRPRPSRHRRETRPPAQTSEAFVQPVGHPWRRRRRWRRSRRRSLPGDLPRIRLRLLFLRRRSVPRRRRQSLGTGRILRLRQRPETMVERVSLTQQKMFWNTPSKPEVLWVNWFVNLSAVSLRDKSY